MQENNNWEKLTIGLLIAILFIVGFNAYQIMNMNNNRGQGNQNQPASQNTAMADPMNSIQSQDALSGPDVIPKGIPDIYGKELGVSFDDVKVTDQKKADATIAKIGVLDQQITLKGDQLQRYIDIASMISCEYCCGADSIIFPDGKAACGCQHSFAMRGLAKYLIKNHGSEFTNEQILEEMGKWKTLFFPQAITAKAKILQDKGIELNYINLASNKYRNIENEA